VVAVKTVLIADDEPGMRLLATATLASGRFRIVEAADGEEAWRLLLEHRPDVALLDVMMPGRDGLALARAIRAEPALARTRVVLLSANAQEAQIRRGLDAGADTYLTKPFSPSKLLAVVERALGLE
jgi:CheY-like chemotaxis protein